MSSIKQERIAERIREILSELLIRDVADPRLQGVTVTQVKIDPELMFASISVNALGEEERRDEVLAGLKSASGFMRREVGRGLRVRNTPHLHFHWDASLERGERIHRLLADLDIPAAPPEDTPRDDNAKPD